MSLLYQLLNEHGELLKDRGYNEASLNSPDKEGWFMKQLSQNMSRAINDIFFDDSPTEFTLRTVGFFNNEQDIIRFDFHYSFDPQKASLKIYQLDIRNIIEHKQRSIMLTSNKELPHSIDALNLLQQVNYHKPNRVIIDTANSRSLGKK